MKHQSIRVFMLKKSVYVFLVLAVLLSFSCGGKKESSSAAKSMEQLHAENGQPVSVRQLETEDFSVFLKYSTIVHAASESTASASINDVVRTISVRVGDKVKQDDVIISFSADNVTLRQATLAYENAQTNFTRSGILFGSRDISQAEFDQVRLQYEIAKANHKAANDMVFVKAPISGVITQINVRLTENVRPGTPLFTVSNQNGYEARFYVGVEEIERIKVGARAFLSREKRRDVTIEGRIVQVSQMMDSQKQAFPVTAFFDGREHILVSGISADISVETYRNEKAIVLLQRELIDTETGPAAFIADGNSVRKIAVQTGAEKDMRLEIVSGLRAGDSIVSEGVQRINAESKLNIVPVVLSQTR